MTLLYEIEQYLARTGTSAMKFGILSKCRRGFVYELRSGRIVGDEVASRAIAYMAAHPPKRDRTNERAKARASFKSPSPGFNRQPPRLDHTSLTRVDGRACFNCGAAYARCGCHGASA